MGREEIRPVGIGLDQVALDLQALRASAGLVSYAEIARRVGALRKARGGADAESRPARTTVYDAFRLGRSRVDVELVVDIARTLGCDEQEATAWRVRCIAAMTAQLSRPTPTAPADPAPVDPPQPLVSPAPITPAPVIEWPPGDTFTDGRRPGWWAGVAFALLCVGVNVAGAALVSVLHLPIYLDMCGTAAAAFALGARWGGVVGLMSNLAAAVVLGPAFLPFVLVNVAGGVLWGWGLHRPHLGASLHKFLALNVLVAFVCTLISVPIIVAEFGGSTGHAEGLTAGHLASLGTPLVVAVFVSNLVASVLDKSVAGFVGLTLCRLAQRARIGTVAGDAADRPVFFARPDQRPPGLIEVPAP